MTNINPYLNFDGKTEEAMTFYKSVFGGEFIGGVMRWGEVPGCDEGEMKLSDEDKGKVMHMALPISQGNVIMASDSLKGMGPPLAVGNNVTVAVGPDTREEADRLFEGLSAGGNVQMPMADAFWGGCFGSFEDKFGINWLINVDTSREKKNESS
jgi:PhnB protein